MRQNKKNSFCSSGSLIGTALLLAALGILASGASEWLGRLLNYLTADDRLHHIILYAKFLGGWAVILLILFCSKEDRCFLQKLRRGPGNSAKSALTGAAAGFAMNSICVLAALWHGDVSFSCGRESAFLLMLCFAAVFLQAGEEELLCRLYAYQKLKRGCKNELLAVIVPAVAFSLFHMMNRGITALALVNILLFGIFYGLAVFYFDSLWFCLWHHTLWNYTQNILFGLPNSGIPSALSVFDAEMKVSKDSFFYHAAFGVEGSLLCTVILAAGIMLMILFGKRVREKQLAKEELM